MEMGACSVVNVKAGRLGGYLEAVKVHDLCAAQDVPGMVRRDGRDRDGPRGQYGPGRPAQLFAPGGSVGVGPIFRDGI